MVTTVNTFPVNKIMTREFSVKLSPVENNKNLLEFSFSSEEPVDRWFFKEVLSHDPESVDFSRVSGMNWLWNHNMDVVLGKVEKIWLAEDRRAYCQVRWSKKDSIAEYRQDVEDGILTNVSFMYEVQEYERMATGEKDDDYPTYVGKKWKIYEVSLVSVPADASVGIGRALLEPVAHGGNHAGSLSTFTVGKPESGATEVTEAVTIEQIREQEKNRVKELLAIGESFKMPDLATQLINDGTSLDNARKIFLEKVKPGQAPIARPVDTSLGMSHGEQKSYSLLKALRAIAYGGNYLKEASFEMEVSEALSKKMGQPLTSERSFLLPVGDLKVNPKTQKRDSLLAGTANLGGNIVDTDLREQDFIELLRNQMMVQQLGARMLTGLVGPVTIPTQATAGQSYWVGEGEDVTESNMTFGQISLALKTVGAIQRYTRELMMQSDLSVENLIREDISQILALSLDRAALAGTGTSNQPRGILNTSGIGSVALGTNGGQPTWAAIVNVTKAIKKANAMLGEIQWLGNADVESKLMTTPKQASGVEGNFILSDPGNGDLRLRGYRFYSSEQVPSNLTKGTGTGLSALIAGVWSQLIIGQWGVPEIQANIYSDQVWGSGAVSIRGLMSADIVLRHRPSFAVITDMITT
jgi:HK97 family phage major capsid protein/HK97 family phage prohead protease